jgi:hypothetical protein
MKAELDTLEDPISGLFYLSVSERLSITFTFSELLLLL